MDTSKFYGKEKISRILLKIAPPVMLAQLIQALYNIVDSLFVGKYSETGLTALSIIYPLQLLMIALAVGTGVGINTDMAYYFGIRQEKKAEEVAGIGTPLAVFLWIVFAAVCYLIMPFYARISTNSEEIIRDVVVYGRIVCVVSIGLFTEGVWSKILQARGDMKTPMVAQIAGAITNIILDPILIFGMFGIHKFGIAGAAIATVIGQEAAGCLALLYLRRLKTVHIRREDLRPTRKLTCRILALGLPSLLTQMLSALVQITLNNLMRAYGAATVYGSDIALSVYGMMMKVYQIAHSMFVGVSSAIQPINGYNFGANHYARVQKTFHIASLIAVGISVVWFLIFMVFPRQIASCFVSDNALYLDCAQHCFRLYMLAFFLYGLHMTSASFFQGIGRPGKSLLIPLARQGCFLIPLALLLSRSFGLDGALLAAPIADALAFLLCLLLARWEFRSWRRKGWLCKGERKYRAS